MIKNETLYMTIIMEKKKKKKKKKKKRSNYLFTLNII